VMKNYKNVKNYKNERAWVIVIVVVSALWDGEVMIDEEGTNSREETCYL